MQYPKTIKCLLETVVRHPELFQDFKVDFIMPSQPEPNPFMKKELSLKNERQHKSIPPTASEILGRMTSVASEMAQYRKWADAMQRLPFTINDNESSEAASPSTPCITNIQGTLNRAIAGWCTKKSFRPRVHAEVHLLDWIHERQLKPDPPVEFFFRERYIGTSKPACKLCDYYFAAHPSSFRTRQTHGNLYPAWRFPSVMVGNERGEKERENMLNKVVEKVRGDVTRALRERTSSGRNHDSNTSMTWHSLGKGEFVGTGGDGVLDDMRNTLSDRGLGRVAEKRAAEIETELWRGESGLVAMSRRSEFCGDSGCDSDSEEEGGVRL